MVRRDELTVITTEVQPGNCARACFRRTPNSYWGHGFMELELNQGQLIERYHLEEGEKHERILSAS